MRRLLLLLLVILISGCAGTAPRGNPERYRSNMFESCAPGYTLQQVTACANGGSCLYDCVKDKRRSVDMAQMEEGESATVYNSEGKAVTITKKTKWDQVGQMCMSDNPKGVCCAVKYSKAKGIFQIEVVNNSDKAPHFFVNIHTITCNGTEISADRYVGDKKYIIRKGVDYTLQDNGTATYPTDTFYKIVKWVNGPLEPGQSQVIGIAPCRGAGEVDLNVVHFDLKMGKAIVKAFGKDK